MKKIILFWTFAIGITSVANSQTNEIKPLGIYQEIDISRHIEAIQILNGENKNLNSRQFIVF